LYNNKYLLTYLSTYLQNSLINKMLINCNKTKEMIIEKAKLESTPHLEIDGKQIERVSEFKIQGLQL